MLRGEISRMLNNLLRLTESDTIFVRSEYNLKCSAFFHVTQWCMSLIDTLS